MRRREFIGLAALTLASRAQAQPQARLPIVGFLGFATAVTDRTSVEGVRQGLRDIGHVEGETILVDARHADGDPRRATELIADMVGRPVESSSPRSRRGPLHPQGDEDPHRGHRLASNAQRAGSVCEFGEARRQPDGFLFPRRGSLGQTHRAPARAPACRQCRRYSTQCRRSRVSRLGGRRKFRPARRGSRRCGSA